MHMYDVTRPRIQAIRVVVNRRPRWVDPFESHKALRTGKKGDFWTAEEAIAYVLMARQSTHVIANHKGRGHDVVDSEQ